MKNIWLGVCLLVAVMSSRAFGQTKQQDRVANAGKWGTENCPYLLLTSCDHLSG
jgi:hypothetical protein